jgi:GNAT superfamily N-acetyltransferase
MALRTAALRAEPFAFAASPADDRFTSPDAVRAVLDDPRQAILGAFAPALAGMLGIYQYPSQKMAHKAAIWGVYVHPDLRGCGTGAALLEAAITWALARPEITRLNLVVSARTAGAARLYARRGFVRWGVEPGALHVDGVLVDDHHMTLMLDRGTRTP